MASLVLNGNTSGSVTISSPAVSGTTTLTLPTTTSTLAINGPAFRAYQSTAQSALSGSTETKILLQTEDFDTNNNFASSRFTPTVAGYYQINGSVQINGTTTFLNAIIYKNGSVYKYGTYIPTSLSDPVSVISDIVYCNGSTDYIELYANTGTSRATSAGTSVTSLSGALVRSA